MGKQATGWRRWLATDCVKCRRLRAAILWGLVMYLLIEWWWL